ncbi:hypothetical protein ACTXT7_009572 [Hymenolepis weldensis]
MFYSQDTSYSSSQVDPLGISYCSQTSRDSALEPSQSEKPQNNDFWSRNAIDKIQDKITEIDAMISKFHTESSDAEDIENINYKLQNATKKMQKFLECVKSLNDRRENVVAKITSVSDYLRTVIKSQSTSKVNESNGTPGTYTFGKTVMRNPKFDSPTGETGSDLVKKTPKFSIKFWNRSNFDSTAKILHTENWQKLRIIYSLADIITRHSDRETRIPSSLVANIVELCH